MTNFTFTLDEINLIHQWYNHIQDTAHPDYLQMADVALGNKLTRLCKNAERGSQAKQQKPEDFYRWFKVDRVPKLGDSNVTFIWFRCYETSGGKFACQVLEGFGIHENYKNKPALVLHNKVRYFRDIELRNIFIHQQKLFWGIK